VPKPDAGIFLFACDLFGVAPVEAWYVGDRLETDAVGARSAGLRGVWLDRTASAGLAERARASALGIPVIHSLGELPALVRSSPTPAGAPSSRPGG
jgi:putative hydrolase of the HAD superfamily